MKTIPHADPGGCPPVAEFEAPLLSDDSLTVLERMSAGERWPRKQLQTIALKLCRVEREIHAAAVAGDKRAECAAMVDRLNLRLGLTAEREAVADVLLASLGHSIELKPVETAELFAKLFASPAVLAAMVPVFEQILKPTVAWLQRELGDVAERVADLELAVSEAGVPA